MPLLQRCSSPAEGRAGHHKRSIAVLRKEKNFGLRAFLEKDFRLSEARFKSFFND
jgi:hypothetical protein